MTPGPEGIAEVAVGALAVHDGRVLLVRRARPPGAGMWSLPGGRVRFGEELHEAVVREVVEETGMEVVVERFLGWVERIDRGAEPHHFVILDFLVDILDPTAPPRPGDDAAAVTWFALEELSGVPLVDGLHDFLLDHGVLDATEPLLPPERP